MPTTKKEHIIFGLMMCTGMVLMMSIYGMISASLAHQPSSASVWSTYLHTIARNFSLALPYQLIILGPLVRYVFGRFIKGKGSVIPST
ncbi:hypothetical protein [Paenibacillus pabuli]|uniref:hypothetical protein n=1 Tax=Paenibacillus pabuli TaxID=1472 RepID=UPI00157C8867|nr:hypothetical protein [Paenibacillus pabuli]MEC0126084.1 hypothetical protein [Paenibacillus pabuli]